MIDTITLETKRETTAPAAMRRVPAAQVATAPARVQWPWGMVSVLGLTVLAVIPFVR
jgi:hypothetical protein